MLARARETAIMENKPGNGSTSPFGNGAGATSSGASKGGHDFVAQPSSNTGGKGGHDFVRDPKSGASLGPGADMVKDPSGSNPGAAGGQKSGAPPTLCPESVPAGGRLPFKGAPKPNESGGKPFKI